MHISEKAHQQGWPDPRLLYLGKTYYYYQEQFLQESLTAGIVVVANLCRSQTLPSLQVCNQVTPPPPSCKRNLWTAPKLFQHTVLMHQNSFLKMRYYKGNGIKVPQPKIVSYIQEYRKKNWVPLGKLGGVFLEYRYFHSILESKQILTDP